VEVGASAGRAADGICGPPIELRLHGVVGTVSDWFKLDYTMPGKTPHTTKADGGRLQGAAQNSPRLRPRESGCHFQVNVQSDQAEFVIDIQLFQGLASLRPFRHLAASSSTSSTVNSTLVTVSISMLSDVRWLLVLI
jgi:hypothetical protein